MSGQRGQIGPTRQGGREGGTAKGGGGGSQEEGIDHRGSISAEIKVNKTRRKPRLLFHFIQFSILFIFSF